VKESGGDIFEILYFILLFSMEREIIICVDDEHVVLESLRTQLKKSFGKTYQFEFADSGREALSILSEFEEEKRELVIILSDWLMPDMKGDELLIEVQKRHPRAIKLMLTGQVDEEALKKMQEEVQLYSRLNKPWNEEQLINTLKNALQTYGR
jgi:CheY-like chemotaxis protein